MRDPNRINKFCDELKTIWHQVPDWRFGQLMWNIISFCQNRGKDSFFLEDEELFENYMKEMGRNDG